MYLIRRWRVGLISIFLVVSLLATERRAEPYGDTLQVVLPLAGLGCSVINGDAFEYLGRFAAMWLTVRLTKQATAEGLGERPHGGRYGFPSAHTSSAVFGASYLVFRCADGSPVFKTGVVLAAAFTGGSRMEVRAHDVWQILAGALWGLAFERLLRRPGPLRDRIARLFRRRGARTPDAVRQRPQPSGSVAFMLGRSAKRAYQSDNVSRASRQPRAP
jgi:membrane-associated phospholipid phosphatase